MTEYILKICHFFLMWKNNTQSLFILNGVVDYVSCHIINLTEKYCLLWFGVYFAQNSNDMGGKIQMW